MISFTPPTSESKSAGGDGVPLPIGDAGEMAAEARRRLAEADEILKIAITNRPALAIGAALAVGVILGWLIKRR
jgi:ElaB/YqjD/DUF883 family membrane-anchored ribosome-binding protein